MERDCLISHGGSGNLFDSLYVRADTFSIPVCDACGVVTNSNSVCQICQSGKISNCIMPYAAKLMKTELEAGLLIGMKITPSNN
jgi:DNA-directed RNA polymerase beta subunit